MTARIAYIATIEVLGLFGEVDFSIDLKPGLNIIYGENGAGKTTLLHIIANLCDRDLSRFLRLKFDRIRVRSSTGALLELQQLANELPSILLTIDGVHVATVSDALPVNKDARLTLAQFLGGRPVYLPAFRSVLEAITRNRGIDTYNYSQQAYASAIEEITRHEVAEDVSDGLSVDDPRLTRLRRGRIENNAGKTVLCREWFGQFVPIIRFPSLQEVAEDLAQEVQAAQVMIANGEQSAVSEVFVRVLDALALTTRPGAVRSPDQSLENIGEALQALKEEGAPVPEIYSRLSDLATSNRDDQGIIAPAILGIYGETLRSRLQTWRQANRQLATLEKSVNRFLRGKTIALRAALSSPRQARRRAAIIALSSGRAVTPAVLSSGERHVLTLLFSATHLAEVDGLVLVDEPELSLHVDWQHIILTELLSQTGQRQLLVCTHSPEVTADHRESMVRLAPTPAKRQLTL